jgi:ATP-binding cassette subfamily A (ABC1) protein 3
MPAWIIVGLTWHYRIFSASNAGLILVVHLLLGLTLASWSFFIAASFGKSPQLAAVTTTLLCIVFAILALVFKNASDGSAFIFTLIFPPGFYIFAIRAICGWESNLMATNIIRGDPDNHLTLLPQLIAAIVITLTQNHKHILITCHQIDIFLWPYAAVMLERYLYEPKNPSSGLFFWKKRRPEADDTPIDTGVAISVRNLQKTFKKSPFSSKDAVTAIADLSFDVPKTGIFVLLGSNGYVGEKLSMHT